MTRDFAYVDYIPEWLLGPRLENGAIESGPSNAEAGRDFSDWYISGLEKGTNRLNLFRRKLGGTASCAAPRAL
jgi:hypothetical protein